MRSRIVAVIFVFCLTSTFGQSSSEIRSKYGKSARSYSVSEHISVTEYRRDGQVCQMRFYPKQIDGATNSTLEKLPYDELRKVLNELVPIGQRGLKKPGFGSTATGGSAAWTTFAYEKVTFVFISESQPQVYDGRLLRKGDFVFPAETIRDDEKSESLLPSNDDFQYGETSNSNRVQVSWEARKCVRR